MLNRASFLADIQKNSFKALVSESVQADQQMIQDSFIGYKSAVIFIYGQSKFETRQIVVSTSASKIFLFYVSCKKVVAKSSILNPQKIEK